jgi:hypothetical protein
VILEADQRFGHLTVIEFAGSVAGHGQHRCRCDCGTMIVVLTRNLITGNTTSCGCGIPQATHGHTRAGKRHPLYKIWSSMKERCFTATHQKYADYGGRGITVCERWVGPDGFPNFLADMGERPSGYTLDRLDNDGPYSPENCRWVTSKRQNRNQRRTRLTDAAANAIRTRYATGGVTQLTLAHEFGTSQGMVSEIVNDKRWV